jgi:hypothetical protein
MCYDINPLGMKMYLKELDRQARAASSRPVAATISREVQSSGESLPHRIRGLVTRIFRAGLGSQPRSHA